MERKLENNWRFAAPTKSRRTFKLERLLGLSENRGVILFGGSLASLSEDRAVMVFNNPEDLERISVKIVEFNTNDGTIASTSVVDEGRVRIYSYNYWSSRIGNTLAISMIG